jgi:hypothetical protein
MYGINNFGSLGCLLQQIQDTMRLTHLPQKTLTSEAMFGNPTE